nr:cupredoxin domain-containing protein [uncultured Lichenicoccus sp.]
MSRGNRLRLGSPDKRPLLRWGSLILLAGAAAARHGWAAEPAPPSASAPPSTSMQEVVVSQHDRAFSQRSVQVPQGGSIRFDNDDDFTHQVFVQSPGMSYESDEQQPGQSIRVRFPKAGSFDVQCHIHPKMHLRVIVK